MYNFDRCGLLVSTFPLYLHIRVYNHLFLLNFLSEIACHNEVSVRIGHMGWAFRKEISDSINVKSIYEAVYRVSKPKTFVYNIGIIMYTLLAI